jgi:uncharacterized protein Usg
MASLIPQLKRYRLTTAEILYHFPDHPDLLQTYVWWITTWPRSSRPSAASRFLAEQHRRPVHLGPGRLTRLISPGEIRPAALI